MGGNRKHYGAAGEHALTHAEVQRLLESIPHLEDEALLRLAIATGIRREDLVAIPLAGVDLDAGWIAFHESKKNRTWKVPIGGTCLVRLRQHINSLPKGTPWLFPSPRNPKKHLSGRAAYDRLQARLDASGLRRRPFHALRATCIKEAQRAGWSIEEVMRQTGDTFRTIKEHYDLPSLDDMDAAAKDKAFV